MNTQSSIRYFVISFVLVAGLLFTRTDAATITCANSGNWSAGATWPSSAICIRTGTITTSTSSTSVTGVGTSFLTELGVGSILKTTGGAVLGTVASITSATSLTLAAVAGSNNSNISFSYQAPAIGDDVIISSARAVTLDISATCNSLTLNASSSGTAQLVVGAHTLTVSNNVIVNGSSNSGRKTLILLNNVLSVLSIGGNLTLGSTGSAASGATLDLSNGLNTATTLKIAGSMTRLAGGVFTAGTGSVVNFIGSSSQTIDVTNFSYANIQINNTNVSGAILGAAVTTTNVTGNISVGNISSGSLFSTGNFAISLNNAKTLTVALGSTMVSGTSLITFGSSGTVTINGIYKTAKTEGFSGATTTSISSTNSPSVTIGGSGTIEYNGAAQTVTNATYNNLTINQSSGTATLNSTINVNGILTLTTGTLTLGTNNLVLGASASISVSTPSSSKMIIASGTGQIRKTFAAAGSFTFPIGDNISTAEYSPVTIDVSGSAFSTAYIGVSVGNVKHANNASTTNYLKRYWNITQSGITGCTATITGTYLAADINGSESSIDAAQLNGTFNQSTNPWLKYIALGSNTLFASTATITSGLTSVFTGISNANPSVSISGGGGTICNGIAVPLTATGTSTGTSGSFVYSWSPTTGLSSSSVSNPTATPAATTTYTVTARNGNGISATNTTTITVNPRPTSVISGITSVCNGTVSIALTGTPPWNLTYFDGTTTTPESNIISSPFTFSSSPPSGSLTYTVTALTDAKCTSQASDRTGSAIITTNTPATIISQPSTSTASYCPGDIATQLSVTADGGGGTITGYQWYSNVTNTNSGGALIVGATSSTYTPSTSIASTLYYYCEVTSSTPCTVTSDVSGAIVIESTPSISVQPSTVAQSVCQNETSTTLFVTADGGGLAYEWYSNTVASNSGGTLINGATTSAFTPPTSTVGTLYYYVIVYGSCLPEVTSTVSGSVTVMALPVITTQPSSSSAITCLGVTASAISVTASGTGLSYQWYSNTSATNNGGTAISGAVSSSYIPSTATAGTFYYYCIVSSSNTCSVTSDVSGPVTVPLVITTQPASTQTLVIGSPVSFTVEASSGSTYQWYKNGILIGGATSSTYTIPSAVVADAGTYNVVVSNTSCGVSVTSSNAYLVSEKPTVQTTAILFSSITATSLKLTWGNGNGSNRIVVASEGTAVDQTPVDAVSYTAAPTVGSGGIEIASGSANYVVYNGSGNTVTVTGLLASTNYYFRVYEYNGTGSTSSYLVSTASGNPNNQSTRPSVQASAFSFSDVTALGMTLNWSANGDGIRRIVVARAGSAPHLNGGDPTDGVVYTANSTFGSGTQIGTGNYVVYNGTGNAVAVTGLSPGTTYYYNVYEFSGTNAAATATDITVYLTSPVPVTSSQATPTTSGPTTQASNIIFTAVNASSLTLSWTNGNGQNRMLVGHASAAVNTDPVDGTTYTANAVFGSGTQIGSGNYVLFNGSGNSVTITGLVASSTYYFKVYEYNNAGSNTKFATSGATNNPNYQSTRPDVQASAIDFPAAEILSNQILVNWTNGNGTARIVVAHEGSAVDATPVDGVIYTANAEFQSGTELGSGNYVVYNGTGTAVTVTNLQDGTDYFFQVFEYSGANASPGTTDLTEYLTTTATTNPSSALTPARFAYRSKASGDWSNAALWQTFDTKTGLWKDVTQAPKKNNNVTISVGDLVTLNTAATSDQIIVNGTLTIGVSGSLTIDANTRQPYNLLITASGKMEVFGSYTLSDKAISSGHLASNTHFYSSSIYNHAYRSTEGILPLGIWDTGSVLKISGYNTSITASALGNWSQSFSNIIFDCSLGGSSTVDMNGLLTLINGDLTVSNTGNSGQMVLNGTTLSPAINIGGNVVVSPVGGNTASLVLNNSSGSPAINISKSITASGSAVLTLNKTGSPVIKIGNSVSGSINVTTGARLIVNTTGSPTLTIPTDLLISSSHATGSSFNSSGNPIVNIDGSLTMSGAGGLLSFGSGTAAGNLTLNLKKDFVFTDGTISNTSTNTSNFAQVNFIGTTQMFSSPGTLSGKIHFNVSAATTLDVGTSAISGTGDFTLSSNAILKVGSTHASGAIQSGAATGSNLQNTGSRTFASSSTIDFNGTTAQFIGNAFPASNAVNLTISNSIGVTAPSTLTLAGDLTNNGKFNHNNGTVSFSGNAITKGIKGTSKITFNNITVNAGGASPDVRLENSAGAEVTGILDLTTDATSTFDADGTADNRTLTLLSSGDDPTVDASVAQMNIAGGQLLGKVTVQRFMSKEGGIDSNTRIYRYISSPVQSGAVADIQMEIPVTGSFTGTSTCTGCIGSSQSMFSYNEAVIGGMNTGYIDFPANANTETLVPGVGYAIFVRGNILSSALWDVRSTINSGAVPMPVFYHSSGIIANDGWNLVGNPFPSTINWDAASGWTKLGLDNAIYTRDNGGAVEVFATYINGVGTNGGTRNIAMGQGFWVKANGLATPSLIADERVKSSGTQTTFFREASPENLLRISLSSNNASDETVIYFKEGSSVDFDKNADAWKLANASINLSSILPDGKKLAINSLPRFDCNYEIALAVENVTAGNYALNFSELESFSDKIAIKIRDNFLNTEVDIRNTTSYSFTVTSNAASFGTGRFVVMFSAPEVNTAFEVSASDVCIDVDATIRIEDTSFDVQYQAIMNGDKIRSATGNGSVLSLTIPKVKLIAGQNIVMVKAVSSYCSQTISERTITFNAVEIPGRASVENGKRCREGVVALKASGSPTEKYNWYENGTDIVAIADQHSSSFVTSYLLRSKNYSVAAVNSLNCEGPRVSVLAEVVQYDDVKINAQTRELISSYVLGNQWYFNEQIISGASGQSIKPTRAGIYKVVVEINGCVTSDQISFPTGPTKSDGANTITVYPNPMHETVSAMIANPSGFNVKLDLTDVTGNSVQAAEYDAASDGIYTLNIKQLPAGFYFLRIQTNDLIQTVKLQKE